MSNKKTTPERLAAFSEPRPLAVDLSQVEAPNVVVKTTLERFGRIDALLNIAGAVPQIDLFEMNNGKPAWR